MSYLDAVELLAKDAADWGPAETLDLAASLNVPAVQKAISLIMLEAADMSTQFRSVDLGTAEGVARAMRLQGVIEGIELTIQRLVELAEKKEN